jgi:hypothetical protein
MKVIQQLITYFEERGKLSRKQIKELTAKGYRGQYSPDQLRTLERKVGQSFFFQVTGDTVGPLWGTDVYTSDSHLGTACVHAGILRPNEHGAVKVTVVSPPTKFGGTRRHGVLSNDWNTGWSGAYRVEALKV